MKHSNNLAKRLTDIKVAILKTMIVDNLDAPLTVKAFKIKHKDLFDELVRLEKLLEEKNKMRYKETEELNWCQQTTKDSSSLPIQKLHQLIAYMTQELVRLTELNDKYESYLKEKENGRS